MLRILCPCLLLLAACSPAGAALDPEVDKPYQLQVVLLLGEHRVFTPVFREQLERELRDNLQTALGSLARVRVEQNHPLREEIQTRGLLKALDSVRLVDDQKVHFILVDFVNGQYELQTRQYDGSTAMPSAEVRRVAVGDRQLVGRSAALLVEQDFGLLGTLPAGIGSPQQGQAVTLTLKGGKLGAPLDRWVQKGEVFAIAQIREGAAAAQAARVPDAYLRVAEAPRDGICICHIFYRWSPALPGGPGVLGFRCLKLGTTEARLRVRVVRNDRKREPLLGLSVLFSRDFATPGKDDTHTSGLSEPVQSRHLYSHLAFATIYKQTVRLAGPFPVPVLGETPIPCPVGDTQEADLRGPLESRLRSLARSVADSLLVYGAMANDFNRSSEKSPETALKNGRQGLRELRGNLTGQQSELLALRNEARSRSVPLDRELAELEQRMEELRGWYARFEEHLTELDRVQTQLKDPRIKEWQGLLQRARALEDELEIDQALELYDKVFALAPKIAPDLRERVAALKRDWALKNNEHRAARNFIYLTWPRLAEGARIQEQMKEAKEAFRVCREAGDRLTLQKLLRACKELVARLRKESDGLRPTTSEDDRREAEVLEAVATELAQLIRDVSAVVERKTP